MRGEAERIGRGDVGHAVLDRGGGDEDLVRLCGPLPSCGKNAMPWRSSQANLSGERP